MKGEYKRLGVLQIQSISLHQVNRRELVSLDLCHSYVKPL